METVTLRITGSVTPEGVQTNVRMTSSYQPESRRKVYFGPDFGEHDTPVMGRYALTGQLRAGPLIIEEYEGTTVVPPNCAARLDAAGNIVIEVGLTG
jgi:N-methylhydantoinase A